MDKDMKDSVDRLAGRRTEYWWGLLALVCTMTLVSWCSDQADARVPPVIGVVEELQTPDHDPPSELGLLLARAWVGLPPDGQSRQPDPSPVLPAFAAPMVPATEAEQRIIQWAMTGCKDIAGSRLPDPWDVLTMLRMEEDLGVPNEYRGISVAAWCRESGYATWPIEGDGGLAIGPLQIHTMVADGCGSRDLRGDLLESTWCWLSSVQRTWQEKGISRCGKRHGWSAAQAWVTGGHRNYKCDLMSKHLRRLRQWQRHRR